MDDFVGRKNLIPPERLRALSTRSDWAGSLQMASHALAIVVTGVALHLTWGSAWAVIPFVLHGIVLNYLFAAQHELNHYTAFKTRWPNDFLNRITGFIILYPRDYERWFHFEHHRYTQDWNKDPELLIRGGPYSLSTYLPYLLGITYWTGRIKQIFVIALGETAEYFTEKQSKQIIWESRAYLVAYAATLGVSLALESWAAVIYWLAPLLTTKVFQNVQNITEHTGLTHEPDTVHNTRTINTWRLFRWLAWNMQYHTAHHTFPAVPFHKLPELHAELVRQVGYEPPTSGYLAFQWSFIRKLLKGPEHREGVAEIAPVPAPAPEQPVVT